MKTIQAIRIAIVIMAIRNVAGIDSYDPVSALLSWLMALVAGYYLISFVEDLIDLPSYEEDQLR